MTAVRPWGCKGMKYSTPVWLFHCDCGNDKPIRVSSIGKFSNSCNHCGKRVDDWDDYKKDSLYCSLHNIWTKMRGRCNDSQNEHYPNYGGRGIKVYKEWNESYSAFKKWALNNGYNPKLNKEKQSLDRIDFNSGYNPHNCRWADRQTQNRNKRDNIWVDFHGEKILLVELADRYDIPRYLIGQRYRRDGFRGDDLIKPTKNKKEGKKIICYS